MRKLLETWNRRREKQFAFHQYFTGPCTTLHHLAPPGTTWHHLGLFTQITGRNAREEEERCNGEEGEVTSGEWKESSPFSSFSSRQCERPLLSPQTSAWACTWSKVRSEKAEREARRTHLCCLAVRRGQPSRHLSLLFETILLPRSQTHSFQHFSRCNFSELSESSLGRFKASVLRFLWHLIVPRCKFRLKQEPTKRVQMPSQWQPVAMRKGLCKHKSTKRYTGWSGNGARV